MKLLTVWVLESLENLPLIFGFVVAARGWRENPVIGLVALVVGMGLGVLLTRMIEPRLHKTKQEVRWVSVFVNFVLFVALAIPFLFYFRLETRWINWKTDILGGVTAGILLTFIQSLHWIGPKSRMFLHGMAMSISFPIILLGLRFIVHERSQGYSLFLTLLLVLFSSMVITLIDYREMYLRGDGE